MLTRNLCNYTGAIDFTRLGAQVNRIVVPCPGLFAIESDMFVFLGENSPSAGQQEGYQYD